MSDKKKQGFHAVEANVEEMEEKIRRHRKRIAIVAATVSISVVVLIAAYILNGKNIRTIQYILKWNETAVRPQSMKALPDVLCVIIMTGRFMWMHPTIRFGIRHMKCSTQQ